MKVESLEIYGFHMTNSEMWTYETASIRKGDPGAEDVNTLRTESLLWLEANHVSLRRFTAATPGYPCVSFICTAQWCTAPPEVCIQTVRWGWNVFLPFTHCDIWTPSKLNVRLFPARLSKHRRTCGESHASSQSLKRDPKSIFVSGVLPSMPIFILMLKIGQIYCTQINQHRREIGEVLIRSSVIPPRCCLLVNKNVFLKVFFSVVVETETEMRHRDYKFLT